MDRRRFLKIFGGSIAVASVNPSVAFDTYPVLYSDGVHCDADAFEAFTRGEKIIANDPNIIVSKPGAPSKLNDAVIFSSRTLRVKNALNLTIENSYFRTLNDVELSHLIYFEGGESILVRNCVFDLGGCVFDLGGVAFS